MEISESVTAIRQLDALPEARRRYLAMLAADARTDADRARLVFLAQDDNRRVRRQTEAALKAEFSARARWAVDNTERPTEAPQTPTVGRRWSEEGATAGGPRPVTVTWGPITRTATEKQTRERKPLMGQNKKYADKRVPVPKEPKPRKQAPEHGLTAHNKSKCRCDVCRAAKSASRTKRNLRGPDGTASPHGTISRYSNNKCRCDECRAAAAQYQREWRERQRKA